jgi:hypothetical protein
MDKRDSVIHPCDVLTIPVFATYRAVKGIAANKGMFGESDLIVLRYVEDDGKQKQAVVPRPERWEYSRNYWDTDANKWVI